MELIIGSRLWEQRVSLSYANVGFYAISHEGLGHNEPLPMTPPVLRRFSW